MRRRRLPFACFLAIAAASSLAGCHSRRPHLTQAPNADPERSERNAAASPPAAPSATVAPTPTAMTIEDTRKLRDELARFSKTNEHPHLPPDVAARLRDQVPGEPVQLDDVLSIPPWRLTKQSGDGVELTWTLDLGHESGTRLWLIADVERLPDGWNVRTVTLAQAHARRCGAEAHQPNVGGSR
jgi:hypothetical protein